MTDTVRGALDKGRRATLEALSRQLTDILVGKSGHKRGCECECGTPWDAGKVAGISRELREVMKELEDMPTVGGGGEVDRLTAEREERRKQAEANASEGE